jgi:uncharacterized membrane protein YoaK (UPF0700 family)
MAAIDDRTMRPAPRPSRPAGAAARAESSQMRRLDDDRVRDTLLVGLTVSTGAVDALSWLGLGKVFSAFMTGNLVYFGFRAGGAAGPSLPRVLAAVAAFAVGALLGARIVAPTTNSGSLWPRRVTLALGAALVAQAAFLALWVGAGGHPSNRAGDTLVALSALAMGMQTSAVFSLGVRAVFTTAATATLAVFMGDLSGWAQSSAERRRLFGVVAGLVVGAAAGGFLVVNARTWAPVFPLVISGLVVATASRWGRAMSATST